MLKPEDHQRIAKAIAQAEERTSGEVFCIVVDEVSKYREIPLAWAAATALVLPPAASALGLQPWTLMPSAHGWGQGAGFSDPVTEALTYYATAQGLIFAAAAFLAAIPAVRRRLTPRFLKQHRVKRAAYAHFATTGLANVRSRTGVLIFASLKDRQVELVADEAIHKAVGDAAWTGAASALVAGIKSRDPASGFIRAIEICGAALSEHFPPGQTRPARGNGDGVEEL